MRNDQASACLVGLGLAMPGVTFAIVCSDGFGLSSGIGAPYTIPICTADFLRQALNMDFHDFKVKGRPESTGDIPWQGLLLLH